jgi:hypothetical protein
MADGGRRALRPTYESLLGSIAYVLIQHYFHAVDKIKVPADRLF